MAEVIREYGAAILATIGGILLFGTIGKLLLSQEGILVQMIAMWGNGGC
jgi:hypothetical protein